MTFEPDGIAWVVMRGGIEIGRLTRRTLGLHNTARSTLEISEMKEIVAFIESQPAAE